MQPHQRVEHVIMRFIRRRHVAVEEVLSGFLATDVKGFVEVARVAPEGEEIGLERLAMRTTLDKHLWCPFQQRVEEHIARVAECLDHPLLGLSAKSSRSRSAAFCGSRSRSLSSSRMIA